MSRESLQVNINIHYQQRFISRVQLQQGEKVALGRDTENGISLPHDDFLDDEHLFIDLDGQGACRFHTHRGDLYLNGVNLEEALLSDGDRLQVGQETMLHIDIQNVVENELDTVHEEERLSYDFMQTASGMTCAKGDEKEEDWKEVFAAMAEKFPVYLLVDFEGPGLGMPEKELEGVENLLGNVAKEYRQGHSLHMIPADRFSDAVAKVDQLRKTNCVIVIFANSDPKDIEDAISKMPAWFVNPNILSHMIQNGEPDIIEQLTDPIDVIFTVTGESEKAGWSAFGNPSSITSWEKFGLPNAPNDLSSS